MKKIIISLLLAALFISCEKDEFRTAAQSVQTGDEICFGTYLPQANDGTKTEYGEMITTAAGKAFEVFWKTGDEISVCCPEAVYPSNPTAKQFEKIADYTITRNDTVGKQNLALKVEKSHNPNLPFSNRALQWSNSPTHTFYAVYPAKAVEKTDAYSFFYNVTQNQVVAEKDVILKGNTYIIQPSMDNAIMYAYTKYDQRPADGMVELKFKPISTVLEITINGPAAANTQGFSISKVTVSSVPDKEGHRKAICGKYQVNFNKENGTIDSAVPIDNGTASNTISVSTTRPHGIPLESGEKAIYRVFLAPDLLASDQLSVSVSTPFGTLKKILDKTEIQAMKVNRVQLPEITRAAANNNWISDLDPHIYITELSYPGSKMSVLVNKYQKHGLAEQLQDGVRAFIIQTSVKTVGRRQELVVAGDTGAIKYENAYVPVSEAIKPIADYMASNPKEFGFIMFTFRSKTSESSTDGNLNVSNNWMKILLRTCREMSKNKDFHIYRNAVDPNTTIADVAGQLLLKANYNSPEMLQQRDSYNQVPLLLSIWEVPYPQNGVPLYWGRIKEATMTWFYQEVTTVSKDGSPAEASYDDKVSYMNEVFKKSVDLYNRPDGKHDIWYVNDLGGRLVKTPEYAAGEGEKELAKSLHETASTTLRQRDQNAALGLIFMNFADRREKSGQLYGSDWLIQTIIDNNFKFALRKAPAQ